MYAKARADNGHVSCPHGNHRRGASDLAEDLCCSCKIYTTSPRYAATSANIRRDTTWKARKTNERRLMWRVIDRRNLKYHLISSARFLVGRGGGMVACFLRYCKSLQTA